MRSASQSDTHTTVVGIGDDGAFTGMAGGYVMEEEPGSSMLYGMWVEPEARGTQLATRLVAEVVAWARTTPSERLTLWVTETNARARRFYEREGFGLVEGTIPLRSHPHLTLLRMALPLR